MLLEATDIRKSFATGDGPLEVLGGVDLTLEAGETLALTGESGSGKSTLLHIIAALDTADSGRILLNGEDIAGLDDQGRARVRRTTVGIVFQQFNLIPSLTVGANLSFQARLAGREDAARTRDLAERLGITPLLSRYPESLSGGQQQRVAIGRALAGAPALLLADEPTGNLDEANSDIVLDLMLDVARKSGAGVLMVTHSARLADRLSRRVHLRGGRVT